jgi:hypothetical protein
LGKKLEKAGVQPNKDTQFSVIALYLAEEAFSKLQFWESSLKFQNNIHCS